MAGERGPLPKRTEERRRRNKPDRPVDRVAVGGDIDDLFGDEIADPAVENRIAAPLAGGPVPIPEANPEWHEVAVRIYESLPVSGQSIFFEPSDWASAYLICESISRDLSPQKVNVASHGEPPEYEEIVQPMKGANLAAYLKGLSGLGMTEGDRRRMSIELTRVDKKLVGDLPEGVTDIATAREGLLG